MSPVAYVGPDGVAVHYRGPGSLVHRRDSATSRGPSGCLDCGWRGVPTFINGQVSDVCPACGTAEQPETRKIGRNDPCPCGSGRKYKRCCGG